MEGAALINNFINSLPFPALCVDQNFMIKAYNRKFAHIYKSSIYPTKDTPLGHIFFIDIYDANVSPDILKKHLKIGNKTNLSLRTYDNEIVNVSAQINNIELKGFEAYQLVSFEPLKESHDSHKLSIYQNIFDNLEHGVFISIFNNENKGKHGQFIHVNEVACKQLGYSQKELLKLNARTLNPRSNQETIKAIGRNIKRDGETSFKAIHVSKDGKHHSVSVIAKLITIDNNFYILSICDYLHDSNKEAEIEQSRFGRLIELSWDEIYVFNTKNLRFDQANTGALDNLGYSKYEISQLKITDLLQDISESTFHRLTRSLFDGNRSQVVLESVFKRKDETQYPVEIRIQLSHSEVPPVYLANVQNITARKETEKNLIFLANHDSLTGLYNRNMFIKKLKESIELCKRSDSLIAVLFLDLDGFKHINDTMGHDIGDKLIARTAQQIMKSVRNTDSVARLGGDEFTVILTNIKHTNDITSIADKIISNISSPCTIQNNIVKTSCSIGITVYPFADADNAYTLIKQADTAMYQAKASGKNTYTFYAATLAQQAIDLRQLEDDIKNAFFNGEFEVYYQSKVTLENRKIYAAEALLRWNTDKYPNISPIDFIPIMEKSDFITKVDLWVLETTCQSIGEWLDIYPDLVISINLSAMHFTTNTLASNINDILIKTGVSAKNIEVEITEGVLIANADKAKTVLNELKELGLSISLDDFGSGYSSLSYLKQLPINCLKIDRSFVMDLEANKDSQAIIEAIINLASSLGLSVIAEGVESDSQANILTELRCYHGQGYLFSKPCPAENFFTLLQKNHK